MSSLFPAYLRFLIGDVIMTSPGSAVNQTKRWLYLCFFLLWGRGDDLWDVGVGVCHRDTKTLSVPTAHTHTAYRWEIVPRALKCLHSVEKRYLILPRILCKLNVRHDFFSRYSPSCLYCVYLISRGTNFLSNNWHQKLYTRRSHLFGCNEPVRLTSQIHVHVVCFCPPF